MQLLVANNAATTLAAGIAPTDTTCSLQAGTGSLFPSPTAGQYFEATIVAAASGLVLEIVYVTGISGDTVTSMMRGQEGTTAGTFLAGDLFRCEFTAGAARALVQMQSVAGDPNGTQPGVAASSFGAASTLWDTTNDFLWICVTGGPAGTAVWFPIPGGALGRLIVLTQPLTLYVAPPPLGSDTNNTGLSPSSPFATIAHAYFIITTRYNINGFGVTISVATGTYSDSVVMTGTIIGSGNAPILLSASGPVTVSAIGTWLSVQQGAWAALAGEWTLNVTPPASGGGATVSTLTGGRFTLNGPGVSFGDLYVGAKHLAAAVGSRIELTADYTILSSSGDGHWFVSTPGQLFVGNILVNVTGNPTFTEGFAIADECGVIEFNGRFTSRAATGPRFAVTLNGVINTSGAIDGGDPLLFPGDSDGTISTGGQYI